MPYLPNNSTPPSFLTTSNKSFLLTGKWTREGQATRPAWVSLSNSNSNFLNHLLKIPNFFAKFEFHQSIASKKPHLSFHPFIISWLELARAPPQRGARACSSRTTPDACHHSNQFTFPSPLYGRKCWRAVTGLGVPGPPGASKTTVRGSSIDIRVF